MIGLDRSGRRRLERVAVVHRGGRGLVVRCRPTEVRQRTCRERAGACDYDESAHQHQCGDQRQCLAANARNEMQYSPPHRWRSLQPPRGGTGPRGQSERIHGLSIAKTNGAKPNREMTYGQSPFGHKTVRRCRAGHATVHANRPARWLHTLPTQSAPPQGGRWTVLRLPFGGIREDCVRVAVR